MYSAIYLTRWKRSAAGAGNRPLSNRHCRITLALHADQCIHAFNPLSRFTSRFDARTLRCTVPLRVRENDNNKDTHAMLLKVGKSFEVELSGFSSLFIRIGAFERFYNRLGLASH